MLADREVGTATCTRHADGRVSVDQADPIIHIATELLASTDLMDSFVVDGDLVSFGDINRVTYRIVWRGVDYVQADRVD